MNRLAPSILSADFSDLGHQIEQIERAGAHYIHVDVMDGHFVPNITIGSLVTDSLVGKTKLPFDVHLMIEDPDKYAAGFVTPNTEFITVHAEACTHLHRSVHFIKSLGVKAGIALNPATPVSSVQHMLNDADMILIMSVNPGFGGQKFIPFTLEKVKELNRIKKERNLDFEIEIDGGITSANIASVAEAGVTIAVAGAAVFKNDSIEGSVKSLVAEMNR